GSDHRRTVRAVHVLLAIDRCRPERCDGTGSDAGGGADDGRRAPYRMGRHLPGLAGGLDARGHAVHVLDRRGRFHRNHRLCSHQAVHRAGQGGPLADLPAGGSAAGAVDLARLAARSRCGECSHPRTAYRRRVTALSYVIAGPEATGGAGIQVDLKTFQALGTYGVGTLTCIVSFDPADDWNHRFVPVEPQVIADQIEAATTCHHLDVVKIGMLGTPDTIDTVATALGNQQWRHVVLDPVLICKGQQPG